MAWTLAAAQTRTGVTDGSKDVELQASLDTALLIAERYCDRRFFYKRELIKFYDLVTDAIQLPRYPVENVESVVGAANYKHVHHAAGKIVYHGQRFIDQADVTYSGGYKSLPADLELALWMMFDNLWAANSSGTSAPTIALGAVKTKTLVGIGSITYETGGASSSDSDSADLSSIMPGSAQAILNMYRRLSA